MQHLNCRFAWLVGVWALFVGLGGCGRPATKAECEEIVERMARLQIESTRPARPETIQVEVEQTKAKLHDKTMEYCVGKRVTNRAMECVRKATTAEAVELCFR